MDEASAAAALDAMFRAMGIDPTQIPPDRRHAMAEETGRVFYAMANAMRRLLDSRRMVKRELGVAGTQIEFGANPLKFSPTPEAAVEGLLRPLSSGYLSGEAAVDDAVDAMQGHQLALVGAIRSAIRVALEAFDPDEIERKIGKRGLSQVVPSLRRAELWERFREDYARFAAQADDDIRVVIGRELDKLYASSSGSPTARREDKG
jgi:type VI secretion system FHA domain protein